MAYGTKYVDESADISEWWQKIVENCNQKALAYERFKLIETKDIGEDGKENISYGVNHYINGYDTDYIVKSSFFSTKDYEDLVTYGDVLSDISFEGAYVERGAKKNMLMILNQQLIGCLKKLEKVMMYSVIKV